MGKCGGSSSYGALSSLGIHLNEYHGMMLLKQDILNKTIIVTIRDPFERIISAFNARHPHGGQHPYNLGKIQRITEMYFYQCFEELNDFVNALNGTSYCSEVARSALTLNCTKLNNIYWKPRELRHLFPHPSTLYLEHSKFSKEWYYNTQIKFVCLFLSFCC